MQRSTGGLSERYLDDNLWSTIIRQIEGIHDVYTVLGNISSLGRAQAVREEAMREASRLLGDKPRLVVDVGAGPGDSVRTAARLFPLQYIVAVEPSPRLAHYSCSGCRHICDAVQAVAEYLPLRSDAADLATAFYAARDYKRPREGIKEMVRVARAVAIGDIFLPESGTRRIAVKIWVCYVAPAIAAVIATRRGRNYRGICHSLKGWCSVKQLADFVAETIRETGHSPLLVYREVMLGGLGYVAAVKA